MKPPHLGQARALHHALVMLLAWGCGYASAHETLVWHDKPWAAPEARAYAAAATDAVNKTMYMAGGFSHAYQACLADFWVLDLGTKSWQAQGSSGGRVPTSRGIMGHTLTLFYGNDDCRTSGCLLLIGGTHLCSRLGQIQPAAAAGEWNTDVWMLRLGSSPAWVKATVQPTGLPPMAFHTATVLSSAPQSVILTGGLSPDYTATSRSLRLTWDTPSASFVLAPLPNMPVALFGHSAVTASPDLMHIVGGLVAWPRRGSALEDALPQALPFITNKHASFSLSATAWTLDSLEAPSNLASAFQTAWLADGTLYTFGGIRRRASPLTALSAYDTTQGVWLAEEIMVNQTIRMISQNGNNYGPPMVVGAASVDVASQALPPSIQPGNPLYPTDTRSTTSLLIFGGWQLPAASRELKIASGACVDDELTWGWSVADAWSLVAHGAPSRRVDATSATVLIKDANGDTVPKLLMYGGRVPGSVPSGKSAFRIKLQPPLDRNGGPDVIRLTEWATSYWFSDWWLLDSSGSVPPLKLRVASTDATEVEVPGARVRLNTITTEGGRGAGRNGLPRVVWEQRLSNWMNNQILMHELVEADGKLRPMVYAAAVFHGSQPQVMYLLFENQPMIQHSRVNSPCMPRLRSSLNTISYSINTNCPNGRSSTSPCLISQLFDYFALAGGLVLDVPAGADGGVITVSATSDVCLYDFTRKAWIPPDPKAPAPPPRYQHVCSPQAYSTGEFGLVCYGGLGADNVPLGDTTYFTMQADNRDGYGSSPLPTSHTGTWQVLAVGDHTPGPRYGMDSMTEGWQTQETSLRGVYFMTGGRTGPSQAASRSRAGEVWMLWFDKKCKTGNQIVAIWTQAHANPPPPSTNGLMPTPIYLGGSTLFQAWLPAPLPPGAEPTVAGSQRVELTSLSMNMCGRTLEPRCSPGTNSFRWDLLDQGVPSPCWAAATLSSVNVEIRGRSPLSSTRFQGFGTLESLYTSTITADVKDEDGVSIITQSLGLSATVAGDALPILTYLLPTLYIPPPRSSIKVNLSLMTYGWMLATTQVVLSGNAPVKVTMSLPPVKRATFRAVKPAGSQDDTGNEDRYGTPSPSPTSPALADSTPPTESGNDVQPNNTVILQAPSAQPNDAEVTYEVWVVTPDGRKVQRACLGGTSLIGVLLEDSCYGMSAAATDNVTLHFFTPGLVASSSSTGATRSGPATTPAAGPASRARTTLELTQSTVVYQVKATVHGSGTRPPMVGALNVTGSELAAWKDSRDPASGSQADAGPEPVLLLDVAPRPPAPSSSKFNVQFLVTFKSTLFHVPLNLPSGPTSGWVLKLIDLSNFPDFSEPVCTLSGPYQPSTRVVCAGSEALTAGTYLVLLVDSRDDAAIIWDDQVDIQDPGPAVSIEAQMSPLDVFVYFTEAAAPQGYAYPASTLPVSGVQVGLTTQPSGVTWDTEVSESGIASFALVTLSPFTQALRYTASLALPGLPAELQPPKQPTPVIKGSNLQVPLPNILLCADGSLMPFTDPSGTFPSKPIESIVYAPGTVCNWTIKNPGGELTVLVNFSLIVPGDVIQWMDSSRPNRAERVTLSTVPSGVMEIKVTNADIILTLASAKGSTLWGRGIRISWSVNTSPSSTLPTQLILLIVSTASAGGAILAFVLLWHCFYRPLIRTRAAGAVAGAGGLEGVAGLAPDPVRHHVPKRLLRLLPEKVFQGPEVKVEQEVSVLGDGDSKAAPAAGLPAGQVGSSTCSELEGLDEAGSAQDKGLGSSRVSREGGQADEVQPVKDLQDTEDPQQQEQQQQGMQDPLRDQSGPVATCSALDDSATGTGSAPNSSSTPIAAVIQVAPGTAEGPEQQIKEEEQQPVVADTASVVACAAAAAVATEPDSDANAECCSICLAEYVTGDRLKILPCSHTFHTPCIDQWLARDVCCPLCKRDVVELAALSVDPAVSMTAQIILRKRAARRQSLELTAMAARDTAARQAASAAATAGTTPETAAAQSRHASRSSRRPSSRNPDSFMRWYHQSSSGLSLHAAADPGSGAPVQDASNHPADRQEHFGERLRRGISGRASLAIVLPQDGHTAIEMTLLDGHTDRFSWQEGFSAQQVMQQAEAEAAAAATAGALASSAAAAGGSTAGFESARSDSGVVQAAAAGPQDQTIAGAADVSGTQPGVEPADRPAP